MRGSVDKPRWYMVHVEYRKKLARPVTLKELQKYSGSEGGVLSKMQELNAARLSVSRVSQKEWSFIVDELIEGYEDEINGFEAGEDAAAVNSVATKGNFAMADAVVNFAEHNAVSAKEDAAVPDGEVDPTLAGTTVNVEVMETIESEPLTNDDKSLALETAATSSRPASRAGSKKPSSRPTSRATSLAPPPRATSRARSRTPRDTSAQPTAAVTEKSAMDVIEE